MSTIDGLLQGYQQFRDKYAKGDQSIMQTLAQRGQSPKVMVVACCDSRVDPALILQCDPGDLFVVRNVANIIPPYERDNTHHGTSAAMEFAIRFLKVEHLIILGHSQCGGIQALLNKAPVHPNDFIDNWVNVIDRGEHNHPCADDFARGALQQSYDNCLTFPWIREQVDAKKLEIHQWFFDIEAGQIERLNLEDKVFQPL